MKKLLLITCFYTLVSGCSSIHKYNFNDNNMKESKQIHELKVHNFEEIPTVLLNNIKKMGVDTLSILNKYEGEYLNFIFKINSQYFSLIEKKVGFSSSSKIDYFEDTRQRFYNNLTIVGGSSLYIFNTTQKEESGGYDAAIVYWNKFVIPIEKIVKRLKEKKSN